MTANALALGWMRRTATTVTVTKVSMPSRKKLAKSWQKVGKKHKFNMYPVPGPPPRRIARLRRRHQRISHRVLCKRSPRHTRVVLTLTRAVGRFLGAWEQGHAFSRLGHAGGPCGFEHTSALHQHCTPLQPLQHHEAIIPVSGPAFYSSWTATSYPMVTRTQHTSKGLL